MEKKKNTFLLSVNNIYRSFFLSFFLSLCLFYVHNNKIIRSPAFTKFSKIPLAHTHTHYIYTNKIHTLHTYIDTAYIRTKYIYTLHIQTKYIHTYCIHTYKYIHTLHTYVQNTNKISNVCTKIHTTHVFLES